MNLYVRLFVITVYVTVLFSKGSRAFELFFSMLVLCYCVIFKGCIRLNYFSMLALCQCGVFNGGLPPFELFFLCMVYVTVLFSKGIAQV